MVWKIWSPIWTLLFLLILKKVTLNRWPLYFFLILWRSIEHKGPMTKYSANSWANLNGFFLVFRFTTSASTHGINILFACLTIVQTFLWLYKKLNFLEDRHNQRAPTLNSHWHQVELERILMTEKKYHENSINDKSNNNNSSFHCDKV